MVGFVERENVGKIVDAIDERFDEEFLGILRGR